MSDVHEPEEAYEGRAEALEEIETVRAAVASWFLARHLVCSLRPLRPMFKAVANGEALPTEEQNAAVLALGEHDTAMRSLQKLLDSKIGSDNLELLTCPGFAAYLEEQIKTGKFHDDLKRAGIRDT